MNQTYKLLEKRETANEKIAIFVSTEDPNRSFHLPCSVSEFASLEVNSSYTLAFEKQEN